jgi:hypothetical protein
VDDAEADVAFLPVKEKNLPGQYFSERTQNEKMVKHRHTRAKRVDPQKLEYADYR